MSKVSIGLRGWRFDEAAVFADDGSFRPLEEMPPDTRRRINRLTALVNRPCGACWLEHGDEEIEKCNPAEVVYGEPMAEVLVCDEHEPDFVYWFHEVGGSDHRGTDALQDAFYEWFADGGRAPEGYAGVSHVDTAADELPDPEAATETAREAAEDGETEHVDVDGEEREADDEGTDEDDAAALDLSREYPR